jgi:hypothetical protein
MVLQRLAGERADGDRHLLQALRALLRGDDDFFDLGRRRLLRQRDARGSQSAQHAQDCPPDRLRVAHVVLPHASDEKIAIANQSVALAIFFAMAGMD